MNLVDLGLTKKGRGSGKMGRRSEEGRARVAGRG
jgi:hypothetical protein